MNKAVCGTKESAPGKDALDDWVETVLMPTLAAYSPNDIYNGDETALFYKCLPHRTYCFGADKPAGSAKRKDRITLMMITNMSGSDHRKLSVIGKAKTPRCLQKKYKMQVKDMAVDWYASKNAWMTGEIHHQIMLKLNRDMQRAGRKILYICDNASSHQVREYSNIKFLMLPPNATSILQPLDQGIIMATKRRYKKQLAERYLVCVENNKDANSMLKALDIVQATNMIAKAWRDTSATIIQNCFRKAGFKHHAVDPEPEFEGPPPQPSPDVWNRVQRWMGDVDFDEYATSDPQAPTAEPMTDEDIVQLVLTENDPQEIDSDDEEGEIPSGSTIKNSTEFLAIIDQQKAYLKRNGMSTEFVEQLETQIVGVQISLCSKQKQLHEYFNSPSTRADISHVSLSGTMDIDDLGDVESVNTTIASVAVSQLMKANPPCSTPKRTKPTDTSTIGTSTESPELVSKKRPRTILPPPNPTPTASTSTSYTIDKVNPTSAKDSGTQESQLDLTIDTIDKESPEQSVASTNTEKPSPKISTEKPPPPKRFKAHQAVEKIMNMTVSTCSHIGSDSELDESLDCTKL